MKLKAGIVIISIIALFSIFLVLKEKTGIHSGLELQETELREEKRYTLLFVGDIMLDRGVRHMIENYGEGYSFPFLKIKDDLQSADVLFGNLESVISDKGSNVGSIYSFRANPEAIEGLLFAGFNVVSLANNHAFDYGREAFEDMMKRLKKAGIEYSGGGFNKEEAHSAAILELEDGTKIGFLGYTEFLGPYAFALDELSGITVLSENNLENDIKRAKKEADILVVTFHYGDEYESYPNENQKKISRKAIDYGADIVIGHHPHVMQPIEEYEGKYIAYSLGNFVFDQYFSEATMSGFMLEIDIKGKKIIGGAKIYYELNNFYQPEITRRERL